MGLDEKALEAVRKYRFKPALRNGKPVPVIMTIEVDFRLFLAFFDGSRNLGFISGQPAGPGIGLIK